MKPVVVTFVRGPLHLIQATMAWIPEVEVFTDDRDRTVYAYMRDELVYYYDPEMSAKLTSSFDQIKAIFKKNDVTITGEAKLKTSIAYPE